MKQELVTHFNNLSLPLSAQQWLLDSLGCNPRTG
jgi:hypothetical protein